MLFLSFLFFGVLPDAALRKFRIDFSDLLICLLMPRIEMPDCLYAPINPFSFLDADLSLRRWTVVGDANCAFTEYFHAENASSMGFRHGKYGGKK